MDARRRNFIIGIFILILVAGIIFFALYRNNSKPAEVEVNGLIGGEKIGLVENPKFIDYALDEYGLTFDYRKAGSLEMVEGDISAHDYLWPSSELPVERYEDLQNTTADDTIIFNTPIVIYSWRPVVDTLITEGIVTNTDGINYVDMQELARLIEEGVTWAELGMDQLYGPVLVDTTDPNASNSGNMFLGLLANAINGNTPVRESDLETVLPIIDTVYTNIGYMHTSSSDLFSQFMRQGMGRFPLAAGYENQLLEFSIDSPEVYENLQDEIILLYPTPTVWSSHVYIALTEEADVAREALLDPFVQDLAWEEHGFRTGIAGTVDTSVFNMSSLASSINNIMPLPSYDVMIELMEEVAN